MPCLLSIRTIFKGNNFFPPKYILRDTFHFLRVGTEHTCTAVIHSHNNTYVWWHIEPDMRHRCGVLFVVWPAKILLKLFFFFFPAFGYLLKRLVSVVRKAIRFSYFCHARCSLSFRYIVPGALFYSPQRANTRFKDWFYLQRINKGFYLPPLPVGQRTMCNKRRHITSHKQQNSNQENIRSDCSLNFHRVNVADTYHKVPRTLRYTCPLAPQNTHWNNKCESGRGRHPEALPDGVASVAISDTILGN